MEEEAVVGRKETHGGGGIVLGRRSRGRTMRKFSAIISMGSATKLRNVNKKAGISNNGRSTPPVSPPTETGDCV